MRPCFLILDREWPGNISTRKLVIETAKMNVITVYKPHEAIETLRRFPNIDAAVLDTSLEKMECGFLVDELRTIRPGLPVVTVSPGGNDPCGKEQYHVSSFNPTALLDALHKICSSPSYEWQP